MRIIIIWLPLLLLVLATKAEAQTYLWIEPQVAIEKVDHVDSSVKGGRDYTTLGTGEYFGTISFGHEFTDKLGMFAQTSHGNQWGETTAGLSFALGHGLNVGVGAGKEHFNAYPVRLHLNLNYDDAATGSFAYIQFDANKHSSWTWADITQMFNHRVGAGILYQMPGGGIGPKLELRTGDHLGFWIAPVYEWQERKFRTLVGGRLMWEK